MSDSSTPTAPAVPQRTGWAELDSGESVELASLLRRLGARSLDILIMGLIAVVLFFVLAVIFWIEPVPPAEVGTVSIGVTGILVFIVAAASGYEVVQIAIWGQTIGKRVTGIKVVNAVDGGVPGWGKSMGRWAIPGPLCQITIIGLDLQVPDLLWLAMINGWILALLVYVSLTWDHVYRGWHDRVAGTLVVKQ